MHFLSMHLSLEVLLKACSKSYYYGDLLSVCVEQAACMFLECLLVDMVMIEFSR